MFLNNNQKLQIDGLLGQCFLTFAEPIVLYKTPLVTYINQNPNYTFTEDERQPGMESVYVPQIFSGSGTIEFLDDRDNQRVGHFNPNQPVSLPQGYVRLSISGSGDVRDFLRDSEKIVLDNENFKLVSDLLYRGMFTRAFTDVYLQKEAL